jgi:hypothetical protein
LKKIVFTLCSAFLITVAFSQIKNKRNELTRCGTMLRVNQYLQSQPQAKSNQQQSIPGSAGTTLNNYRTNAIVTIPVVVHIVLNNPEFVTDANVQFQIDKLNLDFSGFNPDSTNIPPEFRALRAHSQIRFTLARRSPTGALTNGIDRVRSSIGSDVTKTIDPIKRSSLGGADVWDPSSYLNLWVGLDKSGQDILGYAQFPNSGNIADDGVFINATIIFPEDKRLPGTDTLSVRQSALAGVI